jgi:hypothetical protein
MADLQRLKWIYPALENSFEDFTLNRKGTDSHLEFYEAGWDMAAGNTVYAPLGGEITDVRPDPRYAGSAIPISEVEVLTVTDDGDRIYNTITGLVSPVAKGVTVARGDMLGRTGPGIFGTWDQTWRSYLNLAGEEDAEGRDINPGELADLMGGLRFRSDPEQKDTLPAEKPTSASTPSFEPTFVPPPPDNKNLIMVAAAGFAAWYFMKKGKK